MCLVASVLNDQHTSYQVLTHRTDSGVSHLRWIAIWGWWLGLGEGCVRTVSVYANVGVWVCACVCGCVGVWVCGVVPCGLAASCVTACIPPRALCHSRRNFAMRPKVFMRCMRCWYYVGITWARPTLKPSPLYIYPPTCLAAST